MAPAGLALLWIISGTIAFTCVVAMAADAGWLDWIDDARFMIWFGDRMWLPVKRSVEAAASAVLCMDTATAARPVAVSRACRHEQAEPVALADGSNEIVAWLCPACDTQLPDGWK